MNESVTNLAKLSLAETIQTGGGFIAVLLVHTGVEVTLEVERIVYRPEGWWFGSHH